MESLTKINFLVYFASNTRNISFIVKAFDKFFLESKHNNPLLFLFVVTLLYLVNKVSEELSWAREYCILISLSVIVPELYNRFNNTAFRKWLCSRMWRMPPGPKNTSWIWGYMDNLGPKSHLTLNRLRNEYGKVFSLDLGFERVVMISDADVIRECLKRDVFSARPDIKMINLIEGYGIINSEGSLWKNQRRFLKKYLRQGGHQHDMRAMETRIESEVLSFMQNLASTKDTSDLDMTPVLTAAVSNIICSMLMSIRFHHTDPKFLRLRQLMDEGFLYFMTTAKVNYVPYAENLSMYNDNYNKLKENKLEMAEWIDWIIEMHKADFDPNKPRDLVDALLKQVYDAKENGSVNSMYGTKDPDHNITQTLADLFSAGQETIKSTVMWFMVYMLHNPHVAKKVQQELDLVVGPDRLPTLDDMHKCVYTQATMMEVLRSSSVAGQGTPHAALEDTNIGDYSIPKGTHVTPFLYGVHMDPESFPQPYSFQPERFLSSEGRIHKPRSYMPFSVGRRMCLGDKLAEKEVFMFMSSLLHVYDIHVPETHKLPSLLGNFYTTCIPEEFTVFLKPRSPKLLEQLVRSKEEHTSQTMWLQLNHRS